MNYIIRRSIKVILLNEDNELLLMGVDDPKTRSVGEGYKGYFWTLIGGQIEAGETVLDAAIREVFEETGIKEEDIEFGPLVWFGEFDLILNDVSTHIIQQFIVGRTKQKNFSLSNLTDWEAEVVKRLQWFSFESIADGNERIYPVLLVNYIPDIIQGNYPDEPIEINLAAEVKS